MAIKFMSLEDTEQGWYNFSYEPNEFDQFTDLNLRYTEIWSDDEGSKSIKLADPKLSGYYEYPELVLVDTKFCVKP